MPGPPTARSAYTKTWRIIGGMSQEEIDYLVESIADVIDAEIVTSGNKDIAVRAARVAVQYLIDEGFVEPED